MESVKVCNNQCVQCKKEVSTTTKDPILCGSIHCFAKWFYLQNKDDEIEESFKDNEVEESLKDD